MGDVLLDRDVEGTVDRLCPDAPVPVVDETGRRSRPGGAGLAAALCAADGHRVTLVTALAGDAAAHELDTLLSEAGVEIVDLGSGGTTPEKIRLLAAGRPMLRLDRGASGPAGPIIDAARDALASAEAVLVSDYGRGLTSEPGLREALSAIAPGIPVVWDPHPRGSEPVPGVRLATPNRSEAARLVPKVEGEGIPASVERAQALAARWHASGVAITLGAEGALLAYCGEEPFFAPASEVSGGDTCGAGDRFASRASGLLAEGVAPSEAVAESVLAASRFVARGGASAVRAEAGVPMAGEEPNGNARRIIERVRGRGGTVVATSGCFDLLHAGHVRMIEAARALGDCLVVCLNSDASVRRIKGPDRPLVPEEDRATVLEALGCVDAVVLFDESTPDAVLDRLRPDVYAKGGDYEISDLPEVALLKSWGGQAVILPYVEGRSTTRLIREALSRNAH